MTITVKPDEGYVLAELVVTDKNGDTVKLTDKGDGKYTFKMPASKVEIEVSFTLAADPDVNQPFVDVSPDAYYADAVAWAVENGITNGTSDTTFGPDVSCTRCADGDVPLAAGGRSQGHRQQSVYGCPGR